MPADEVRSAVVESALAHEAALKKLLDSLRADNVALEAEVADADAKARRVTAAVAGLRDLFQQVRRAVRLRSVCGRACTCWWRSCRWGACPRRTSCAALRSLPAPHPSSTRPPPTPQVLADCAPFVDEEEEADATPSGDGAAVAAAIEAAGDGGAAGR